MAKHQMLADDQSREGQPARGSCGLRLLGAGVRKELLPAQQTTARKAC